MAELVKVVVDAMGGDFAPVEPVKAAVEAVKENKNILVILTGQEEVIHSELKKYQDYPTDRIQVVNATEVIETAEPPVFAIRKKKDSSIVVGLKMVKEQKADAFVSSGSTGAVLVGGQVLVGRSKGVERPPLAPLIPTAKGVSLLIDCGANVDARPSHLVQFAKMGSIYMEHVVGIKNPRVAIVNNGAEKEMPWSKKHFLSSKKLKASISSAVLKQEIFRPVTQMLLSVKLLSETLSSSFMKALVPS